MKKNIKLISCMLCICICICICIISSLFLNKIYAVSAQFDGLTNAIEAYNNDLAKTEQIIESGTEATIRRLKEIQATMIWAAFSVDNLNFKYEDIGKFSYSPSGSNGLNSQTKIDKYGDYDINDVFKMGFMDAKVIAHGMKLPKEITDLLDGTDYDSEDSKYYQVLLEYKGLMLLQGTVDTFKNAIETACNDGEGRIDGTITGFFNNINDENMYDDYSGFSVVAHCDPAEGPGAAEFDKLSKKIQEMLKKNEEKIKELLDSGNVDKALEEYGNETISETEEAIDEAQKSAEEAQNSFYRGEFPWNPLTRPKPSLTLDNLSQRVRDLINKGKISNISGLFNLIINDLKTVIESLRYILYAAVLFFGVRTIWTGATGKAQFKELLPYLLLGIVFFYLAPEIIDVLKLTFDNTYYEEKYSYAQYLPDLWGSIINIVRLLAFGGILFTGVKFLFASSEGKADIKSSLLPILIGCILVFASSTVVSIVLDTAKSAGIPSSTRNIIEVNENSNIIKNINA